MATLTGNTIAGTYDQLIKRQDSYSSTGNQIEVMEDDGTIQATALYLDAENKKVGINTGASVEHQLHVQNSGNTDTTVLLETTWDNSGGDTIFLNRVANAGGSNYIDFGDAGDADIGQIRYDHSTDMMSFISGASANNLVLSTGNVGIGIASPGALLDIQRQATDGSVPLTMLKLVVREIVDVDTVAGEGPSIDFHVSETGSYEANASGKIAVVRESAVDAVTDAAMTFWTATDDAAATEKMRIESSGQVGIGTTAPGVLLEVSDTTLASTEGSVIRVSGTGNSVAAYAELAVYYHSSQFSDTGGTNAPVTYLRHEASDGVAAYFWMADDDDFMGSTTSTNIGTTTGVVVGSSLASDERLKDISEDSFPYGLSDINKITPIKYKRKKGDTRDRLGFGAQTIQPIIPESVQDTKECIHGYTYEQREDKTIERCVPKGDPSETKLVMEYHQIIPVLVKAIQELSAKVETLENA